MKKFNFDHDPNFAELWDACIYNLLYNTEEYKDEIEALFDKLKIDKKSKIIDTSAGGGFPALELIKDGYDIDCADGFDDQVDLFNKKAENRGLEKTCVKVLWEELLGIYPENSFDFLFCRGNSFIYADGGWNNLIEIDASKSLDNYKKTLGIFFKLLKRGGWIYLDKFKDTETTHKEKVIEIQVNDGEAEELIFWTERFPEKKIRQASMIRKVGDNEKKVPNITYDLSMPELELMLKESGFRSMEKINFASEKMFDVIIAQK